MIGRAEFFEPETRMVPFSFLPPCTRILSISREDEAFPALVIRCGCNVFKIPHPKQINRRSRLAVCDFQRQAPLENTRSLVGQAFDQTQSIRSAVECQIRLPPDFDAE